MKGLEDLSAEYIERSGEPWLTQNPLCAYGHTWLLKEALEMAGKADRRAVSDALHAMDLTDGAAKYFPGGRVRFDEKGRRYLDGFAGIVTVSVGHCHPKVVAAVREQNERLQHATTIYLHPNIALFAKKLAATFPEGSGLDTVYFVNSGSEANELAVLMARAFTGAYDVVALRNAYHGGSQVAMALTAHNPASRKNGRKP